MKTQSRLIQFPLDNVKTIEVCITKKRMKNIRLKISTLGTLTLSIPYQTSYNYAYDFLVRKRAWINAQLSNVEQNSIYDQSDFKDGGKVFLLGKFYNLSIQHSSINKIYFDNCANITIYSSVQDFDIKSRIIKWCKKYFLNYFTQRVNHFHSQMFQSKDFPKVKIRDMKSIWGNCNFVKNIITLNLYLAKAPIECVDYVIVHELCHLIHHNHSKDFYELITKLMPDWKVRKINLNKYSLKF